MHITFEPAFIILLIIIGHTIMTHIFNWWYREIVKDEFFFIVVIGLFQSMEIIGVYITIMNISLK